MHGEGGIRASNFILIHTVIVRMPNFSSKFSHLGFLGHFSALPISTWLSNFYVILNILLCSACYAFNPTGTAYLPSYIFGGPMSGLPGIIHPSSTTFQPYLTLKFGWDSPIDYFILLQLGCKILSLFTLFASLNIKIYAL